MNSLDLKEIGQLKVIDNETIELNSHKISVRKGSEVYFCVAYSKENQLIHFGLIFKNDWNVNEVVRKYCVAHLLANNYTEKKSFVRIHFNNDIFSARNNLKTP